MMKEFILLYQMMLYLQMNVQVVIVVHLVQIIIHKQINNLILILINRSILILMKILISALSNKFRSNINELEYLNTIIMIINKIDYLHRCMYMEHKGSVVEMGYN